jgi:hypothetical protein
MLPHLSAGDPRAEYLKFGSSGKVMAGTFMANNAWQWTWDLIALTEH